jgi:hypothetical protein
MLLLAATKKKHKPKHLTVTTSPEEGNCLNQKMTTTMPTRFGVALQRLTELHVAVLALLELSGTIDHFVAVGTPLRECRI